MKYLEWEEIQWIRQLRADGMSCAEIARKWETDPRRISAICRGMIYKEPLPAGFRNRAKLEDAQVREIRQALANGESYASIGRRFGVGARSVWNIKTGATWSKVV